MHLIQRPLELLFGKILGKALASILQYGIWVAMSMVFLQFIGPRLGLKLQLAVIERLGSGQRGIFSIGERLPGRLLIS